MWREITTIIGYALTVLSGTFAFATLVIGWWWVSLALFCAFLLGSWGIYSEAHLLEAERQRRWDKATIDHYRQNSAF